ncbi:hypothetical protein LB505_005383 [Fusarium chuoi]|nr:hypothetical protein LB505_005383 [Fusarium chuoi]
MYTYADLLRSFYHLELRLYFLAVTVTLTLSVKKSFEKTRNVTNERASILGNAHARAACIGTYFCIFSKAWCLVPETLEVSETNGIFYRCWGSLGLARGFFTLVYCRSAASRWFIHRQLQLENMYEVRSGHGIVTVITVNCQLWLSA